MRSKNVLGIFIGTAFVLLIPLVAMQFTEEVVWKLFDFAIIGALLIGSGLAYGAIASKMKNSNHRTILAFIVLFAVILIWAELAVGVFGTPFAGS